MKQPVLHPTFSHDDKHGIRPHDQANGSVDSWTGVGGLAGFAGFSFFFFNGGGTGNLSPGRPTTQTAPFISSGKRSSHQPKIGIGSVCDRRWRPSDRTAFGPIRYQRIFFRLKYACMSNYVVGLKR
jgi:hypothetical protein